VISYKKALIPVQRTAQLSVDASRDYTGFLGERLTLANIITIKLHSTECLWEIK
jgi:hypothetical protein